MSLLSQETVENSSVNEHEIDRKSNIVFEFIPIAFGYGAFQSGGVNSSLSEDKFLLTSYTTSHIAINFIEGRLLIKDLFGLHLGFGLYQAGLDRRKVRNEFGLTLPNYTVTFPEVEYDNPGPIFGSFTAGSIDFGLVAKFNLGPICVLPYFNLNRSSGGKMYIDVYLKDSSNNQLYRNYRIVDDSNWAVRFGLETRYNFPMGAYIGLRSSYSNFNLTGTTSYTDKQNSESSTYSYFVKMLSFQAFFGLSTKKMK